MILIFGTCIYLDLLFHFSRLYNCNLSLSPAALFPVSYRRAFRQSQHILGNLILLLPMHRSAKPAKAKCKLCSRTSFAIRTQKQNLVFFFSFIITQVKLRILVRLIIILFNFNSLHLALLVFCNIHKKINYNPFVMTGNSACNSNHLVRFSYFSCFCWSRT